MDDEFPSNSNTGKEPKSAQKRQPEKKIAQVTTGKVVRRKKNPGKRFKELFFGGSDAKSVWGFVAMNVVIPAARDMIADAGKETIDRMVFGESRGPRRSSSWRPGGGIGHTAYHQQYANTRPSGSSWERPANRWDPRRDVSPQARATHDFGEIILDSRGEAEEVLDQLNEIVSQYDQASVSDLYSMVGIKWEYTDQKYGWTTLQGARVSHMRGGTYLLDLPKPEPLD